MPAQREFSGKFLDRISAEEDAALRALPEIRDSDDLRTKTNAIADFLRAMDAHFDSEETAVFRKIDAMENPPAGLPKVVARLRAEHVRLKELADRIRRALPRDDARSGGALLELADYYLAYSELLIGHARYEDERLYALLRKL